MAEPQLIVHSNMKSESECLSVTRIKTNTDKSFILGYRIKYSKFAENSVVESEQTLIGLG